MFLSEKQHKMTKKKKPTEQLNATHVQSNLS